MGVRLSEANGLNDKTFVNIQKTKQNVSKKCEKYSTFVYIISVGMGI